MEKIDFRTISPTDYFAYMKRQGGNAKESLLKELHKLPLNALINIIKQYHPDKTGRIYRCKVKDRVVEYILSFSIVGLVTKDDLQRS